MSLSYLLATRPWRIEDHDTFQNDVQARSIELSREFHPWNLKGGEKDRYEELRKACTVMFIGKLREE